MFEIDAGPIHDVEGAGLGADFVEDLDVVHFSDRGRTRAARYQSRPGRNRHRSASRATRYWGVSTETHRTWHSRRRAVPDPWLDKARQLAALEGPSRRWSLETLAADQRVFCSGARRCSSCCEPAGGEILAWRDV